MKRHLGAAVLVALLLDASGAAAGGMQLQTRGVRPTARGGAFVAGADDLGAMWFNPAGLAQLALDGQRRSFLFDAAYVRQSVTYTRIDSGNNPQDPVENDAPGLPVPTIGAAFPLSDRLVVAGGIYAPYAGLGRYPQEGPQRYSLIDLSESLLVIMQASVAYQVSDRLRVGAGIQNMFFSLASTLVFSGCPGETVCAPEDPEFDALGKIHQRDYFNPSGVAGVQYDLSDRITAGLAFQLPFRVSGEGRFEAVLPNSGFYNSAEVVGDRARVSFTMPAMARLGIEVRPADRWRVELGATAELWSQQDEMRIVPQNVRIEGAPGVGTYQLGPLVIPRHFDNSYAAMIGVEGQPLATLPLRVLAGYSYETAAATERYISVLTVDGSKHLVSGGWGYHWRSLRFDAVLGYVAVADRTVSPDEGMVPQLTPVRDETEDPLQVYVNWGQYESSWVIAGAGISGEF